MIPTPDLSHLTAADYEHVYEPAEDTFILLDALEQHAADLTHLKPRISLEIGSGSGCVSAFLGSILGPSGTLYLCTDINPRACTSSTATGRQNKVPLNLINSSLADPILRRLESSVDILLFNPPYVPTYNDEAVAAQSDRDIGGAWAGGEHGMQVTDVLLPTVAQLLSPGGRFYLVAVAQNNIPEIQRRMKEDYKLDSEVISSLSPFRSLKELDQVVISRRAGREHLSVVCFTKSYTTRTKLNTKTVSGIRDVLQELEDGAARTEIECQKCGHGYAYFHQLQTQSADEPMTIYYKYCIRIQGPRRGD
ncbi:Hemk methyltransferase family member 2-like [Mycena kentingensis (nom. inval.)]|nr:Hemk methyltransferase family member 2-like [Mycena kentingensis (nom. inval.)]